MINFTPWDKEAFGIPTWELEEYSENSLKQAMQTPGHYTIKVGPLEDKRLLHQFDFYYCDTLIDPYCSGNKLRASYHPHTSISKEIDAEKLMAICHGAFSHGRFYRDFNLPRTGTNLRYDNWLLQLLKARQVYGLYWQSELAGFIGYSDNNLVLHALAENYRGQGLSKYWWSSVCKELLSNKHEIVKSSISAANISVLNLYSSLGFSFKNPRDVYHCLVK